MENDERPPKKARQDGTIQSSSSKAKYTPRVTIDKAFEDKLVGFVKKNRPRALTTEERLDILLLHLYLRKENAENGQKNAKQPVTATIAKALRRNKELVGRVWADYVQNDQVVAEKVPSNQSGVRNWSIPETNSVLVKVQGFIRDRRETRSRIVAKDVLEFLVAEGIVDYDLNDAKSAKSGIRTVQRYLQRKGYKLCMKLGGQQYYKLKQEIVEKRDAYVAKILNVYENQKNRRIVYIDESYIHKDYYRPPGSTVNANDEQDLMHLAPISKGQRYFFVGAVLEGDLRIPEGERILPEDRACLLKETLEIFEGDTRQVKDFHGMFDHKFFVTWMNKLLQTLEARGFQNALIVMNDTKYHRKLPEDTPRGNMSKAQLLDACKKYNLPVPETALKSQIWDVLRAHLKTVVQPIICKMAADAGHEVCYIPTNHPQLQPLQDVWAFVKAQVGARFTPQRSLGKVLAQLKQAFDTVDNTTIQSAIDQTAAHLRAFHQHALNLGEDHDDLGDEEDDDLEDEEDDDDDEQGHSDAEPEAPSSSHHHHRDDANLTGQPTA